MQGSLDVLVKPEDPLVKPEDPLSSAPRSINTSVGESEAWALVDASNAPVVLRSAGAVEHATTATAKLTV